MKKKIIGIILTLTMVLTMLPALALPTKAEERLTVYKSDGKTLAQPMEDYSETEDMPIGGGASFTNITIYKSDLVIKGTLQNGKIVINPGVDKITLDGVKIIPTKRWGEVAAIQSNSEDLTINLLGENQLGNTVEYEEDETASEDYFLNYGIVSNSNITFAGPKTASLKIYDCGSGVKSEEGETNKIIFGEDFAGTVKIEHWGNNYAAINSDGDIEILGGEVIVNAYGDGGICSEQNTTIKNDAIVNVYSRNNSAMIIEENLYVGDNAKVTARSDSDGQSTISAENVSIDGKADFSATSSQEMNALLVEDGKVEILSSGSIKFSSKDAIALEANELIIGKDVKDIVLYGSKEISFGAVLIYEEPEDFPENLLVYGGVNVDSDFKLEDIMKEKNKAKIDKLEFEDREGDTHIVYTCFVGDEIANALVIRNVEEPTTPENPKTEDTNSMLMWIVLGLASLAIAAGILLSKKQKN